MLEPVNLNLIIPFMDRKGLKQARFRQDIDKFKAQLFERVEDIKEELHSLFGDTFPLTLTTRSGSSKSTIFWRFTSKKYNRKYLKLGSPLVQDYFNTIVDQRKLTLRSIEEELIYINANYELLHSVTKIMEQSINNRRALMARK